MGLFIGTSGFSYKHWLNGVFYPEGLPRSRLLDYYMEQFNTVEINSTFYRLPSEKTLKGWFDKAKNGFVFSVKLNRNITHYAKLKGCENEISKNSIIAHILNGKLRVVLIQLPPSLKFDLQLLESFLVSFKEIWRQYNIYTTIEFRHKSWINTETYKLLDRYETAVCLSDFKGIPVEHTNDAPLVYIRRHGPSGYYAGSYSKEQLETDAKAIKGFLKENRDVFVYFNNDFEGFAPKNALQLKALLQ